MLQIAALHGECPVVSSDPLKMAVEGTGNRGEDVSLRCLSLRQGWIQRSPLTADSSLSPLTQDDSVLNMVQSVVP